MIIVTNDKFAILDSSSEGVQVTVFINSIR